MTRSVERLAGSARTGRVAALWSAMAIVGLVSVTVAAQSASSPQPPPSRSLIEEEANLAVRQPGPHAGGGDTTAFPFFSSASDLKTAFRKRILHKGSAICYHRQEVDEIYYVLSGTGEYTLNGVKRRVGPGTALLTRPGDSHGLRSDDGDLAIIITYQTSPR